jgi:hypothetical protein
MVAYRSSLAGTVLFASLWLLGCSETPIGEGQIQFSPELQAQYDQYRRTTRPGAFAVSDDGIVAYTYCSSTDCRGGTVSDALALCRKRASGSCYVYDIGGRVVWHGQQTQPLVPDAINSELKSEYNRNALKVDCSEGVKKTLTPDRRSTLAAVMRVRESRVPRTLCDRLVTALASGELTVQEFVKLQNGSSSEATINRLIRVVANPDTSKPPGTSGGG